MPTIYNLALWNPVNVEAVLNMPFKEVLPMLIAKAEMDSYHARVAKANSKF